MMSTGSKRRKVTVDIKPQLKFDRGSVFERLGNQAREKQKKWKDTTELKKSKKQAHKLVGEDNEFVKKSKTSLKTDLPGTSKKSRETDGEKYSHRSDTKDQAKPHKHGGGHRAKLSPEPVKSNSKHKIDAEQAHRIRKMDNLIIEKRISPSSSSHERSRSVSAGSIRSRKKAKKHASKHASPEGEFEKERYKSKSPEPHGHKKYKERGRSREPKRKHEKSQQKFSDERDDFSYEQISPERVKQTSHKKKDAKSAKVVKTAKKDTAHSDKKYTKTKHSKNQDWDENTEKTYSRNASSDELLKEDTHHKSAKKESKRHAGRELKRVNASDEEPVKNKRRKCEVSPPLSSPSRPKKHAKVPFEEEVGKKDKLAQEGKKSATSKSSSSKKKHKDEEILPKKKQKDEFLQPMHSDFSSSSKHSQIEYSEQSDYIDERFSDELTVKEKKKKPKLKKKKKEKETDVHTGTDKSTFENDELIVDKQLKKQAKKRKNKREGRSWSFSESEQERSNVKGGKPEGGRVESKKKKDPYYPPESVKAEPAEKPRRIREHDDIPPPKHSIRDSGSPRHSRRRDISPNRPRKDNTTMENSRREEIFAERPRGSRSREDASVDRLQPDYDHPTKQGRMSDISPKRSHRDVSPRRPHGEERYDERVVMNQPSERLRRDDIATQKHSYRVGLSPRRSDDIGTKQTYRESVVSRRRDDVSPKRIHRDNISPTGLRRERVSPMNQSKLSHVITRKSDVSLKQKEFPREIHEGSKRKRDSYIGLKHSSGDMRFSPERKDDFPRHERRSGHRSMERTRERDWETTQNTRQESGRRRDAPQRLLPERRLDSPRMPGGKFVPQRKMMLEPEIFPPHPPPPEIFPQKERWEKKRDRRPLVPTSRHAMQVERDFQRPSLAQSHPKPKGHLVKEKYSDADRKYFDRKFQDKGWIDPAPRSDSKDRKYLPHDESKDRRMRSGSRDSRSSSQHSREILGKNRQPEVNSRDPSPQNRSSTNIEYKRYNRGKPDTQKERNAGKRNDALTSRESAVSIDRKGKKYVDNARMPTRGRSTERTKLGEAQKLQKLPSKRRHEAIVPAARSSSSSRSSQGRDHSGRKKEGSPRRVVLKSRRKTRDDTQDNPGRKQEHTSGADGERKMPEDITDGELTILIKNDDKAAEAAPEPTIMEVDWNELPQAAETEAPTVKEPSSVLKNFTPSHILLQTGIATELLSPDVLKKLNLLCQQNQAPQQISSPSNDVKNILGGTLHSYNDERLRKRLLGYNTRYRYPLIPPAVINAKTYSSSMKTYMSASPLHRVDCMRAYACRRNVANGMNNRPYYQNGHAGAAWNRTMQPLPINTGMNSINNLSNPEKPYLHILQHPTGTTLEAGEDLMLRCVAEGEQTLIHYSWFKDNVELGMHEKLLIVEDVAIDDSGEYRCEVQQDHIRVSSEIAKVFVVPQNIPEQTPQAPVIPCPSGYVGSAEATYVSLSVGAGVPDPAPQTPEISCDGDGAVPGCSSDTSDSMESNPQSMYHATDKYALLIANEKYLNNPPLTSASNDVKALATTLKEKLQFKTISLINLNLKEMHRAVDLFCAHLSDGAYCLTYLAGHGFENDGQCYIVPTDAPNRYSSSNCFPVKEMIKKIHDSCHLSLTVVLLDVCRKRNENAVNLTQQSGVKRNLGNFVISFATMESGMAYEVKGQRLGVYVSSLRRHLGKDKRVTRVLELVHKDLHRDLHTKGVQQPEFKSNMFEDRKLTDPIPGLDVDPARKIRQWEWKNTHERTKPVGFFFESCGLMISLDAEKEFSNVLQLTAKVHRLGLAESCDVFIKLKRSQAPRRLGAHGGTDGSHEEAFTNSSSVKIENLQRLIMEIKDLPLAIRVQYVLGDYVYTEEHEDFITIPFVTWWHS